MNLVQSTKSFFVRPQHKKKNNILTVCFVFIVSAEDTKRQTDDQYAAGSEYTSTDGVFSPSNGHKNHPASTSTVTATAPATAKSPRKQQKHRIDGVNKRDTWPLTSTTNDRVEFSSNEDLATCSKGMHRGFTFLNFIYSFFFCCEKHRRKYI